MHLAQDSEEMNHVDQVISGVLKRKVGLACSGSRASWAAYLVSNESLDF